LILRALEMGGRCAVIVPDGVLFGSTTAHREVRRKIVEENRLDGVVSMPGGVFKPYAGVSTAVLLFTRGAKTGEEIWFYDMAHDGFSLDDKRQPIVENDIPDILACWQHRHDAAFRAARQARLAELQSQAAPLKEQRLASQGEIHRLQFEAVIAPEEDTAAEAALAEAKGKLAEVEAQLAPLQGEIDRLGRQFWVKKAEIKANAYDLTASRYREIEPEHSFFEEPATTLGYLMRLEDLMNAEMTAIRELLT
jgi:type I restriction enzyme M protein